MRGESGRKRESEPRENARERKRERGGEREGDGKEKEEGCIGDNERWRK